MPWRRPRAPTINIGSKLKVLLARFEWKESCTTSSSPTLISGGSGDNQRVSRVCRQSIQVVQDCFHRPSQDTGFDGMSWATRKFKAAPGGLCWVADVARSYFSAGSMSGLLLRVFSRGFLAGAQASVPCDGAKLLVFRCGCTVDCIKTPVDAQWTHSGRTVDCIKTYTVVISRLGIFK